LNGTATTSTGNVLKRKTTNIIDFDNNAETFNEPPAKRVSSQSGGCSCKTGCKNNRCACKKANQVNVKNSTF
jgi:hypothetical protein